MNVAAGVPPDRFQYMNMLESQSDFAKSVPGALATGLGLKA